MTKYLACCIVSAFMGGLAALWWAHSAPDPEATAQDTPSRAPARVPVSPTQPAETFAEPRTAPPRAVGLPVADDGFTPEERVNIFVYEKCNRSVVNINTRSVRTDNLFLMEVPAEGAGSGSVLDRQGHILTNYHVVEDAQEIKVTLSDGQSYDAGIVGKDPSNDIAVLRITAPQESLFPMDVGDSARLRVGQRVFAVGNPFGLERTMTTAIISTLDRSLGAPNGRTMKSIIQIDAALNRGNSGGPLIDSRGRLIGMNTAIASRTGENTGVGFAIPVDTIKRVVPQLIKDGRVIRPDIGITRVFKTDGGLGIATLAENGPAERAGLRGFKIVKKQTRRGPFVYEENKVDRTAADVIVAVDGEKIDGVDDLLSIIERKQPNDEVVVTVRRENRNVNVGVRLGVGE